MKKNIIIQSFDSVRKKPANLKEEDILLFNHEFKKKFDPAYYLEVKDVTIVNQSIYKIKKLRFFTKYNYFYNPSTSRIFKDIIKNIFKTKKSNQILDKGIWVTDNKTSVYFHMLCDALTRFIFLPEKIKKNYPIFLPAKYNLSWIIEILSFLEIDYILLDSEKKYIIKNAIVTSYTAPSGNFHKETLLKLRKCFIDNKGVKKNKTYSSEKIWIDMSKHRRPVINIKEIEPILKKHGFKQVIFEDLNILNKINLLQKTKVLAGSHSSGLTNMLFMNPGSKIIDIRDPRDKIKNAFFTMASELNLEYFYMEREVNSEETVINPIKLDLLLSTIE